MRVAMKASVGELKTSALGGCAIAICHSSALFRETLAEALARSCPDTEIITAKDCSEYLNASPLKGRLDCALVESALPGVGIRSVLGIATRRRPHPSIIALYNEYQPYLAAEILDCGADAVCCMNTRLTDFFTGMEAVLNGQRGVHFVPAG